MSNKTVSRNAPCPCGSGKKYKACCMNKETQPAPDTLWRQIRQADEKVVQQIFKYLRNEFEEEAIDAAWDEFVVSREDKILDNEHLLKQAFYPWFFFNWQPEEWEEEGEDYFIDDYSKILTIARSYLNAHRHRLTEMEWRFIELSCNQNYSFHEVLDCQPGTGFTLKDILLEREVYVTERSASTYAQKGDILFAKVIQYDQVGLMVGCSPTLIPPIHKPPIIDLRTRMRQDKGELATQDLFEWDIEIRDLYFEIHDAMHTPPKITNTDGDPISMHDLLFEISATPQEAFDRLKSLAIDTTEEELLEEAEFDKNGNLTKIDFRWFKKARSKIPGGDYTTLGYITIEEGSIRVSVNSENRAKKIRKEIEKRLKGQTIHQSTEVKPLETLMDTPFDKADEDLAPEITPEIEKVLEQSISAHWKQWIDDKIPALGGITPRQAIKSKDGREKVIALLDEFERREKRGHIGISQLKYILKVRKQLGLE